MVIEYMVNLIQFKDINRDNMGQYLEGMLASETLFPANIQSDKGDLERIARSRGYVGKVALYCEEYIGNAFGFCPTQDDINGIGLKGLVEDPSSFYLYNIVINRNHQRKGFGRELLLAMINEARAKGFKKIVGHFREGASLELAKSLGAKTVKDYPNWFNTGETYTHCEIDLG